MKVVLAPMEGLADFHLRQILTSVGGYDHCVTEFIRVSNQLLPNRVFYRSCPELYNHGKTFNGTPTHIQLLGSDPVLMAENAARAAELGATAIDLNFGCPAKTVNKNMGGSRLLQYPEVVFNIVDAVRKAVPQPTPVTAKMRLGFEDKSLAIENAQAIEAANANGLTVHARTKVEGYKPPAHWHWIAIIKENINLPVIANGDIWNVDDYEQCIKESTCEDVMIGRGAITKPDLALLIKQWQQQESLQHNQQAMAWPEVKLLLSNYYELLCSQDTPLIVHPNYIPGRLKQWTSFLMNHYKEAGILFHQIKREKNPAIIHQQIIS